MENTLQRIAVLGLGLIGSSLARAVAERQPQCHIAAFDVSGDALAYALRESFIHSQHAHAGQAVEDAQIVVLAAPPGSFASLTADIAPFIKQDAILTDVASVKRFTIANITAHLPAGIVYVPGHPITGSERTGVAAGSARLFTGRRVVLTPLENEVMSTAVARVRALWEVAGARVEYMPAELHDRLYAYVSHLPQLVAFAARTCMHDLPVAADESSQRFARLMTSDTALWADICLANADYVGQALADFAGFASQMEGELSETPATGGMDASQVAPLFGQVVATCLIATASLLQELTGVHPARYAGAGFADMTAPALSDPQGALAGISSHHWVIAGLLRSMLNTVNAMRHALEQADRDALLQAMRG